MKPQVSKEITRREDFGELCMRHGLTGTAIEIGTHRGEFAAEFCKGWKGKRFIAVDPWSKAYPGFTCQPNQGENREADMAAAAVALEPFRDRMQITLMQMDWVTAAKRLKGPIDYGYLDADHHYNHVRTDLEKLYPLISPGGIIAGHDYNGDWINEVRPAVTEFAYIHQLQLFIVHGDAASWYAFKHPDEDEVRDLDEGGWKDGCKAVTT